jgi:hypothetical protein
MSEYLTVEQLRDLIGTPELARLLSGKFDINTLSDELLNAGIDNDELSGFSDDEQADLVLALSSLDLQLSRAAKVINDHLRGKYDLPLAQTVIDESALGGIAESIVVYKLDFNPEQHRVDAFDTANKQLVAYQKGNMLLPIPKEPEPNAPLLSTRSLIKTAIPASSVDWTGY